MVVIDLLTKQITNLCIEGSGYSPSSPVWSPDSQFLAVNADNTNPESYLDSTNVVIVSMSKTDAFKIKNNGDLSVLGWMIQP